jgi:hypothetical protein
MNLAPSYLASSPAAPPPNDRPTPQAPAAAQAIGTQDAPILPGQKPEAVPVRLATQPKVRPASGWWENDWKNVRRSSATAAVRLGMPAQTPAGRRPSTTRAPDELGYGDVVNVDFTQTTIQGRQHRAEQTDRSSGAVGRHTTVSWKDFPRPRLTGGPTSRVAADVPRDASDGSQVSPGFNQQLGPVVLSRTNVLPLVS